MKNLIAFSTISLVSLTAFLMVGCATEKDTCWMPRDGRAGQINTYLPVYPHQDNYKECKRLERSRQAQ